MGWRNWGFFSVLRDEFHRDKFSTGNVSRKTLTSSTVIQNQVAFVVFKFVFFVYAFFMWCLLLLETKYPDYFFYYTNLQDFFLVFYLFISLVLAVQEYYRKIKIENVTASLEVDTANEAHQREILAALNDDTAKWQHRFSWVVHTNTTMFVIATFIIYWALVVPKKTHEEMQHMSYFSVHAHIIIPLMTIVDLLVSDVEVRLLHCHFGVLSGYIYILYSAILHYTGVISAIYDFMDWDKDPARATVYTISSFTCVPIVTQSISFAIYRIRLLLPPLLRYVALAHAMLNAELML